MRDLAAILVVAAIGLVVAFYFDVFEKFQNWAQRYERWQIDELVVVPLVFGLAFGFYSWRRWQELKVETSRREEAQNALEKSEQRFRSLVQNAKDIVMLMNADGTVGYLNPAVEEMLGYKPEDIVGTNSFTPVHPDDDARVQDIFANAMSNPGVTSWMELRLQHADGSWRHIETYCTSLLHDPTVRGVIVNSRDITERKRAEERRREVEERYRTLVEQIPVITYVQALEHGNATEYISPQVEAMLGYAVCEYTSDPKLWINILHPDDRERVLAEDERTDETLEPYGSEYRMFAKDGHIVWVQDEAVVVRDTGGRPRFWQGVMLDVTERRQAEEALRESEERFRLLAENAQDVIFRTRLHTLEVEYISPSITAMIGYEPEEYYADPHLGLRIVHPEDRQMLEDALRSTSGLPTALRWLHKDGRVIWTEQLNKPIYDEAGEIVAIEGIARDITERKRVEKKLQESEANLAQAQRIACLGSWEYEPENNRVYWSDETYRVFGFTPQQFVPTFENFLDLVHPDDRMLVRKDMAKIYSGEQLQNGIEFRIVRPDGEVRCVQGQRDAERDEAGELIKIVGTLQDITERKWAEEALRESEARHRAMLEASPDLVFRVSRDGEYLDFQASDKSMLYVPGEELIGKNLRDTMPPDLVPPILRRITKALDTGEMQVFEYQLLVAGGIRDFEARLVVAGSGEVLAIVRDVTERKVLERRLEHRVFHDSLTGLPNRALFLNRLEHALARAGRHRESVAVLFVDVDNFKVVNDSLGHEAGDALLVAVAERLREILRPEDTLARLSGDEFTVLLEDVGGTSDATAVAQRMAVVMRKPFILEGQEAFVTVSMGIAFGGSSQESPGALLRNADLAMYRAKETGKARHEVFRPEMNERALKRLSLEGELRRALERDELRVHFQPQVLLSTELQEHLRASGRMTIVAQKASESPRIVGMEALVRWEHPERGLLPPDEFVPFAEENGLIVPIGRWVLEQACRQAREWQEQNPGNLPLMMNVNVSAAQFRSPELVEDVARVLRETGLEAGMLTLEITESVLLEEAQANADTLEQLKALGVRLAIDDFGTGYSSLSYLKRLPVDYLKIDRSFVTNLEQDSKDRLLVSGVIYLAHGLGLKVIAEGVEKAEQLAHLQGMGCDMAQGYYFSRPLASEAATILASNSEPSFSGVRIDPLSRIDQS